jgi:hypothetical protein
VGARELFVEKDIIIVTVLYRDLLVQLTVNLPIFQRPPHVCCVTQKRHPHHALKANIIDRKCVRLTSFPTARYLGMMIAVVVLYQNPILDMHPTGTRKSIRYIIRSN